MTTVGFVSCHMFHMSTRVGFMTWSLEPQVSHVDDGWALRVSNRTIVDKLIAHEVCAKSIQNYFFL